MGLIVGDFQNPLRTAWDAGRTVINGWIATASPIALEAMMTAPWGSVTIDMQHGTADYADLLTLLPIIEKAGAAPIVRVPWLDEAAIMRTLDAGALGVIAPMINTAEDARKLVACCLYPPIGTRSFGPIRARLANRGYSVRSANAQVVPFAMIETREAVKNIDSILMVEGLGGLYIGPADLALSYGFEPGFDREERQLTEIISDILAAATNAGVPCAIHCGSPSYASRMARAGFLLTTIGSDVRFIEAAAASVFEAHAEASKDSGTGQG